MKLEGTLDEIISKLKAEAKFDETFVKVANRFKGSWAYHKGKLYKIFKVENGIVTESHPSGFENYLNPTPLTEFSPLQLWRDEFSAMGQHEMATVGRLACRGEHHIGNHSIRCNVTFRGSMGERPGFMGNARMTPYGSSSGTEFYEFLTPEQEEQMFRKVYAETLQLEQKMKDEYNDYRKKQDELHADS